MGSNMMRQAVPLLKQSPFVGTGMESVVARIQVWLWSQKGPVL